MEDLENRQDAKYGGSLGLIQKIPGVVLNKIGKSFGGGVDNLLEVVVISGDSVDNISQFVDNLGGKYESLGYGFGIVTLAPAKLPELIKNTKIQYVELPLNLITSDLQSNEACCVPNARNRYGLSGAGVLVGFIDSGIDYTHPAFRNEDGTTRIEYIYDLSGEKKIYDKNTINEALKAPNPLSIVNVVDTSEHGTHVAGIACAGGKIPTQYYGVAPDSTLAIVKSTRGKFTLSTQIMRGLKFLVDKSKELNMPLVVNMSLSTNEGAHNGSSLLEKYVQTVATLERITVVIAAGNEGEAAHHVQGNLQKEQRIDISIAGDEPSVVINFYKPVLPKITIEIISPTGMTTKEVDVAQEYVEGAIGLDRYIIYSTGAKPFDISGETIVVLTTNREYLTAGRWTVTIRLQNEYSGIYDMWLPISEGLNTNTKFLQPSVLNTLGIPATVTNVIAVGSYNFQTNTISPFSGRGRAVTMYYNIRPDIVAPGENIMSTVPDRKFDSKTGTSMATPHITGIAALMMEWGMLKGNDPYMYGERLKYYLIEGAKRGRTDIKYPDPSWGYGEVCLEQSLLYAESISNAVSVPLRGNDNNRDKDTEYEIEGLFIRNPN